MTRLTAALVLVVLYALHQDFWFWTSPRPLVFGFLPIGLFYHAAYTVAVSVVLLWLMPTLWPSQLEQRAEGHHDRPTGTTSA
jgi:hypothetical protein